MPFPTISFPSELDPTVRKELEAYVSQVEGYLRSMGADADGAFTTLRAGDIVLTDDPETGRTGRVTLPTPDGQITFPNQGLRVRDANNGASPLIVSPGEALTAARTLSLVTGDADRELDLSASTAYVPAWASSGTAPSLGNGQLSGRWHQLGPVVFFLINLDWGSTTNGGTGVWTFGLPVPMMTSPIGSSAAIMFDAGTNLRLGGSLVVSGTSVGVTYDNAVNTIGPSTPFTWATADYLRFSGFYFASGY